MSYLSKHSVASAVVFTALMGQPILAQELTTLTTRGDQSLLLDQHVHNVIFLPQLIANEHIIELDTQQSYQSIQGMGYALTQASADAILQMAVADQNALLEEIFHPTLGNNVSMLRIAIGASDLSTSLYTYSDEKRSGEHFTPDPTKTYYIDSPAHNVRLAANGQDDAPYIATGAPSGEDFEWQFIPTGDGHYFLNRAAGGIAPRLRTDDTNLADMQDNTKNGWWEKWQLSPGDGYGAYFLSLPLKGPGNHDRLQIDDGLLVRMVDDAQSAGTWESFTFTEVGSDRSFRLQSPDSDSTFPLLKRILAINPDITVMATPWTAPLWMKTNNAWAGGSLKQEHYADLADYFVNYLQAMRQQGIDIWGITLQNEPENPWNEPSMLMSGEEQFDLVDGFVGPALQAAGLGDVKILGFDHNLDHPNYPLRVAQSQFIDGSAFHLYEGEIDTMSSVFNASGKSVYLTEMWTGRAELDTPEAWANQFDLDFWVHMEWIVMGSLRNHSRSVIEWNLVTTPPTTPSGCTLCLGAVSLQDSHTTRNVSHYIIAQLSRFLQPGAKRIQSTDFDGDILNVALQNPDGSIVLLVYNKSEQQEHRVTVAENGRSFEHTVTPRTAVTFLWQPSEVERDDDSDGVINSKDLCPNTPSNTDVDEHGCALPGDDDQDGIENLTDLCPQTPLHDPVDGDGCSLLDDDNDGVRNPFDACPLVAGLPSNNGCPEESDHPLICEISKTNDWGNGAQFDVLISHELTESVDNWQATLVSNAGSEITNIWEAVIADSTDWVIEPGQWNKIIPVNGQVSFGLQLSYLNDVSLDCYANALDHVNPQDTDKDGVIDGVDFCPNTPLGTKVDSVGCAVEESSCSGVSHYPNWLHPDFEGGPNTHVLAGDKLVFEETLYQAQWYTSSQPGSDNSWQLLGSCL